MTSSLTNIQLLSKNTAIISTISTPFWSPKDPLASEKNTIAKSPVLNQMIDMQNTINQLVAKVGLP